MRQDGQSTVIDTFLPYNTAICSSIEPVEIARNPRNSKISSLFPHKFSNFNACNLTITTFDSEGIFKNGSELHGRDIDIILALADTLNFTLDLDYVDAVGSWGAIFPNGTVTGAFKRLIDHETTMAIGNYYLKYDRAQIMDFSTVYEFDTMIFIVPYQKKLNSLRKLAMPFSFTTWMLLLFAIACGSFVIFIVTFKSRKIQNFVFGFRLTSPSMNFLMEIFGLSQPRLPKRNFARFLLMNFLIFALIIRSAYQGSLFTYLQRSDYRRDPLNLAEIVARGYKVYMIAAFEDIADQTSLVRDLKVVIEEKDNTDYIMKTLDREFEGAVLTSLLQCKESTKISAKLYGKPLRVAKVRNLMNFKLLHCLSDSQQYLTMMPITLYFPKGSFLVEPVNERLLQFSSSGLSSFFARRMDQFLRVQVDDKSIGRRPIQFRYLKVRKETF